MIKVIKRKDRHNHRTEWINTYWLFSFDTYIDQNNKNWGYLRVFNDDVIAPGEGFDMHFHNNFEIITVVLEGEITHRDDLGNEETLNENEVQVTSSGRGIMHSEFNHGTEPLHLYQIWIRPNFLNIEPIYDKKKFSPDSWQNTLYPLASGQNFPESVKMQANATIFRSKLDIGKEIELNIKNDRKVFIYVKSGTLTVNHIEINTEDQARIENEASLTIEAKEDSEFILIDIPQ